MSNTGIIGVDVGGTFTDCISVKDGKINAVKVLVQAAAREQPVIDGGIALGLDGVGTFNHATTVGLNAILTRQLPKVAFLTTSGHRDILDMGRAWRPATALMDANWRRPFGDASRPLVPRYLRRGVVERTTADGALLLPLDEAQARSELEALARCNVDGVAICLLNAYRNPAHENRLRQLVLEVIGDVPISVSSDVSPLAKEYDRASSTVVDVLMKLIYTSYTASLTDGLADNGFTGQLNFADCTASLTPVAHAMRAPLNVMSSGPAAGTVSCAYFGGLIDENLLICCDIGGTSCDISLVTDGRPVVNTRFEVEHDLLVNTVANEISTVGAGGGSIVATGATGELTVGPASAGGDPGPACYGRGGLDPTTTDTCLLIGILSEGDPLGGRLTLDGALSREVFERLDTPLSFADRVRHSYALALHNIAAGIIDIGVRRGIDPRDYALVAYGSAGPMLLPAILDDVGAKSVIVPPYPGLFSALGLVSSDFVFSDHRSSYLVLEDTAAAQVDDLFREIEAGLRESLGTDADRAEYRRTFDARLVGQNWETPFIPAPSGTIGWGEIATMIENFHEVYEARAGTRFENLGVMGVTYRVEAIIPADKVAYPELDGSDEPPTPIRTLQLHYLQDEPIDAKEYARASLRRGTRVAGPAIIREEMATTQVGVGQQATVGRFGEIVITRDDGR